MIISLDIHINMYTYIYIYIYVERPSASSAQCCRATEADIHCSYFQRVFGIERFIVLAELFGTNLDVKPNRF